MTHNQHSVRAQVDGMKEVLSTEWYKLMLEFLPSINSFFNTLLILTAKVSCVDFDR